MRRFDYKTVVNVIIDGKTFEVDEAVARQSVMIAHLIEGRTSTMVIPNVSGYILSNIVEYCKHLATQPPSSKNDVELKTFVSELGLLSLVCEDVLDMIKLKDLAHIRRLFNITLEFSPEEKERMRSTNPWAFN
ncbi:hypothetical protein M9H77_31408 [Catharanthus roseus]|uniref:Uncharacterized protein n=1 Tax=Catharanthus roseus TaxID=4058 RepID=A0ACC0A0D1_CATRO|nr:hypothetical protein M9H77_31408 [Catharanthus roseus]